VPRYNRGIMPAAATNTVEGCWAASLGDCGGKLSREHTISGCLFPSGKVTVEGFDWCPNGPKTIGVAGLVRRILCERHNSSLSELDSAMLKCFEAIRERPGSTNYGRSFVTALGQSTIFRKSRGFSIGMSSVSGSRSFHPKFPSCWNR
jgi:hypothetical protein